MVGDGERHDGPRLTVIIAALDAEGVLGGQLAALAAQDCPVPWEVLLCDNGSSDGTVALAERWAGRLPLRVIDASGVRGAGPARNAGAQAARGEWLGFCDADDEVADGWLTAICAALAEHSFVAGPFEDHRLNGERVRRSRPNLQRKGLQYLTPGIGLPHGGAGNLGIHRSVFLEVGGFDPRVRYLQDTDLCWRVQLAGHRLVFAPEMVVHVRLRSTFRGTYRQGRNFGAAQAALERKYAVPADAVPEGAGPVDARPAGTGRAGAAPTHAAADGVGAGAPEMSGQSVIGRAARLARWAMDNHVGVRGQIWQLGWHLGHRQVG